MNQKLLPPQWLLVKRALLYPLLAALIGFSACQKTQEVIAPAATATSQSDAQESKDKDEAYKKDKPAST